MSASDAAAALPACWRASCAPVLGTADARSFERGFHDQSAELWSSEGRLLATSHQLVYYRDPA